MSTFALLIIVLELLACAGYVVWYRRRLHELIRRREVIGTREMRPGLVWRVAAVGLGGGAAGAVAAVVVGGVAGVLLGVAFMLLTYIAASLLALREARLAQQSE